jgi:hypothetical protein
MALEPCPLFATTLAPDPGTPKQVGKPTRVEERAKEDSRSAFFGIVFNHSLRL